MQKTLKAFSHRSPQRPPALRHRAPATSAPRASAPRRRRWHRPLPAAQPSPWPCGCPLYRTSPPERRRAWPSPQQSLLVTCGHGRRGHGHRGCHHGRAMLVGVAMGVAGAERAGPRQATRRGCAGGCTARSCASILPRARAIENVHRMEILLPFCEMGQTFTILIET